MKNELTFNEFQTFVRDSKSLSRFSKEGRLKYLTRMEQKIRQLYTAVDIDLDNYSDIVETMGDIMAITSVMADNLGIDLDAVGLYHIDKISDKLVED